LPNSTWEWNDRVISVRDLCVGSDNLLLPVSLQFGVIALTSMVKGRIDDRGCNAQEWDATGSISESETWAISGAFWRPLNRFLV
jgi:hypothetical protein